MKDVMNGRHNEAAQTVEELRPTQSVSEQDQDCPQDIVHPPYHISMLKK